MTLSTPISVLTGVTELAPFVIPDDATQVVLRLARATALALTTWGDAATRVLVDLHLSFDGGNTFNPAFGIGANGGVLKYGSVEATESWMRCLLPDGKNRQGKVVITVTNGPFVSLLTTEAI